MMHSVCFCSPIYSIHSCPSLLPPHCHTTISGIGTHRQTYSTVVSPSLSLYSAQKTTTEEKTPPKIRKSCLFFLSLDISKGKHTLDHLQQQQRVGVPWKEMQGSLSALLLLRLPWGDRDGDEGRKWEGGV